MPQRANGRVLHLIDTGGPGGAETVFLELVRRLPSLGWESVPVVPTHDWLAKAARESGFDPTILRPTRSLDIRYLRKLRRLLRAERIDVIQTHLFGSAVYSSLARAGLEIPVVSTLHGRPDIPSRTRLTHLKLGLLRRNQVVCVSASLRGHFIESGTLADEALVIPNGVDMEGLAPVMAGRLRAELGIPKDIPLVGAVGNIRPSKAYPDLLRAFALVRRAHSTAHLVIAGQPQAPLSDALLALRSQLALDGCVHFLGFREDVPEILGSLDVFALSSTDEGFSLVIVQAMAMGLPVVSTRSGGPEEIVGDSGTAVFVRPGDPQDLAEGILRLLNDDGFARSMGEAARSHVRTRYSVENMVSRYAELYAAVTTL